MSFAGDNEEGDSRPCRIIVRAPADMIDIVRGTLQLSFDPRGLDWFSSTGDSHQSLCSDASSGHGSTSFEDRLIHYCVARCQWLGWNRASARLDAEREGAAREGGPHVCDFGAT